MSFERCPNCGWEEPSRNRKVSQHMNLYAHVKGEKDGKPIPGMVYGILNHHEDVVTIDPDVEGGVQFTVVKVDSKYTYKPPVEAKPAPPNKPVPQVQKQAVVGQVDPNWLKEQPKPVETTK